MNSGSNPFWGAIASTSLVQKLTTGAKTSIDIGAVVCYPLIMTTRTTRTTLLNKQPVDKSKVLYTISQQHWEKLVRFMKRTMTKEQYAAAQKLDIYCLKP